MVILTVAPELKPVPVISVIEIPVLLPPDNGVILVTVGAADTGRQRSETRHPIRRR
ncbi:MAG: hypothetical protein LUP97_07285 [Methanoregula sp.]|nr:hypothetical protein [Methanoregula sp.]